MQTSLLRIVSLFTLLLAVACNTMPTSTPAAEARMGPTQGQNTRGVVTFTQAGNQVMVIASISGLTPGEHGFHIHEKGDCSAADGSSAGGHFNPASTAHGNPQQGEHHLGDLPMLQADTNGNASLTVTLPGLKLTQGSDGIIGRGVIVHAAPDDYKTQPTGNSGGRLACGVIVVRQ